MAKTALIAEMMKPFLYALSTLDCDGGAGILMYALDNSVVNRRMKQMHGSA